MPTKTVSAATMEIGKKGGGKHWTEAEIEARKKAAEEVKRKRVVIDPPSWLDKKALAEWEKIMKDVKEIDLLDNLDAQMLAVYCDANVRYRDVAQKKSKTSDDIKELQAWARIISQYADKLGFTPAARARLVKKRADEKKKDQFGSKFD